MSKLGKVLEGCRPFLSCIVHEQEKDPDPHYHKGYVSFE